MTKPAVHLLSFLLIVGKPLARLDSSESTFPLQGIRRNQGGPPTT